MLKNIISINVKSLLFMKQCKSDRSYSSNHFVRTQ